jgi:hypothetical protein
MTEEVWLRPVDAVAMVRQRYSVGSIMSVGRAEALITDAIDSGEVRTIERTIEDFSSSWSHGSTPPEAFLTTHIRREGLTRGVTRIRCSNKDDLIDWLDRNLPHSAEVAKPPEAPMAARVGPKEGPILKAARALWPPDGRLNHSNRKLISNDVQDYIKKHIDKRLTLDPAHIMRVLKKHKLVS